jgi:rhodanese-related sulfurtransferase
MRYSIFVDMDDVLTDLHNRLISTGKIKEDTFQQIKEKSLREKLFWEVVNDGGVEFWSRMGWTSNGKKLWNLIYPNRPTILSACKKDGKFMVDGKKMWIKKNVNNARHILCLREEKQKFAHPNAVLIDDREENIKEWEQSGGIGIFYEDKNFDDIKLTITRYLI